VKTTCEICGGSGHISFFQGVSRFLLTWEECPACSGTGLTLEAEGNEPDQSRGKKKRKQKDLLPE
jgi:DnaJ-class molecular chaperone